MAEAKTSQMVLDKVKLSYILGEFNSIRELGEFYSIHPKTLQARIVRESWEEQRQVRLREIESKIVKKSMNLGEEYLARAYKRAVKYEQIIDVSMDNLGSKDQNGIPLLDPDAITSYTQAEIRIHELAKSSLRIPDVQNVDITSKGQSIGDSLVSALQKLRETDKTPPLTNGDCDKILEAEVIDEKPE